MTRVLVIESSGNLWGSERALLDLIESAPQLELAVCCPPHSALADELRKRNVRTMPYFIERLHEKSRWLRLLAALGVLRACLEFRPEVIHVNQAGAYRTMLPAATLLGLPVVCHVRIFEDAPYLARQAPRPDRLRALIAISRAIETEIRSFEVLRSIPVHTIYDAYLPVPPVLESSPRDRYRVACVGRLTPIKGQEILLDALALIGRGAGECLMIGDGEPSHVERLVARATRQGLDKVVWCGFRDDVTSILQTCGALVCPSHREPLGRVIFEAWDAGAVPVVFGGAGGAAEIVADAEGGILYAEQTPESLAQALQVAATLPAPEAERLVGNGRRWIAQNCAPGPYGRSLSTVLSTAAEAHSPAVVAPP